MGFAAFWFLYGVPLALAGFAWLGLRSNWNTEQRRGTRVSAILLATAAPVLACGALAYVQFIRPIAAFDYRVESWGVLLSLCGTVLGLVTLRSPRWFSSLALGISAWMFVLFLLAASTY